MSSRAEAILRELVDDPALALEVLESMPEVIGPWRLMEHGWCRVTGRSGYAAIVHGQPATLEMLARSDEVMLRRYPGALVVGGLPPADAPGIVPECGEMHPMALADGLRWPPHDATETARCERPGGHLGACGGRTSDGRQGTASNAVERKARLKSPAPATDTGGED